MRTGDPVKAGPGEQDLLERLQKHIRDGRLRFLSGIDDEPFDIPASIQLILRPAVEELARGNAVLTAAVQAELTPQSAAELLGVSRPYVMRLIEQGELPSNRVGKHHRIPLAQLLEYKTRRDKKRRSLLGKLARESQDLGLQ